jgi:nicotinate-nucleotide pyrophosphorylase (carboxylating)
MPPLSRTAVLPLIRQALHEDAASRDVTSRAVIPPNARIRARIIARSRGVAAGVEIAALTFVALDPSLRCRLHRRSGAGVSPGTTILTVEGRARSILAAERTALNFLGHLSGIATFTRQFVRKVRGMRARILDTRKTIPGLRLLEKNAVRAGGGQNHRLDLSDAVLIKTNHLRAMQPPGGSRVEGQGWVQRAVTQARRVRPRKFVEVEVTNLIEYRAALQAKPDAILLDNWPLASIRRAVWLRSHFPSTPRPSPLLEVSGGVTLQNVRAIARTGVERISIGRLTHSAPALDVSLKVA